MTQPPVPTVPTPPVPPTPPGVSVEAGQRTTAQPITEGEAAFLRTRRDALSSQLNSVQERRDEVADQLRDSETSASERPGLQERLNVLDERLIQIEKEIASNSAQLANAPSRSRSSTNVPAGPGGIRFNGNMITVFSFMLLMPFAIQMARRWFAPDRGASRREQAEIAAMRERMDRMESSIDAVALEVERIGEGQRFLTQTMVGNALPVGAPAFDGVKVRAADEVERR